MERRKKTNTSTAVSEKPQWKKITPGTLYPFPSKRNRRVKPSEIISATKDELGRFVHHFKLVKDGTGIYATKSAAKPSKPDTAGKSATGTEEVKATKLTKGKTKASKVDTKPQDYSVVKNEETGGFNVVSSAGKVMNDEELIEESAIALKEKLEKDSSE